MEQWPPDHPALLRLKAKRCSTVEEVRAWVKEERQRAREGERPHTDPHRHGTDQHGQDTDDSDECTLGVRAGSWPSAQLVANAVLSLLNLCCYLLDRQLEAQAAAFLEEGGFTERLYRMRQARRHAQQ